MRSKKGYENAVIGPLEAIRPGGLFQLRGVVLPPAAGWEEPSSPRTTRF